MLKDAMVHNLNTAEEYLQLTKDLLQTNEAKQLKGPSSPLKTATYQKHLTERTPSRLTVDRPNPIERIKVKSKRVLYDVLVCLAFINFEWVEFELSKQLFNDAYKVSFICVTSVL